ncbi:MAG TPA: tetratricopeptide repeat protein, partial [Pyrinomonadaceae bacterium]
MDWLRPLLLMFYAPARGLAEVRDRGSLGRAALVALAAQGAHGLVGLWPVLAGAFGAAGMAFAAVMNAAGLMVVLAAVFVPAAILCANLLERRGGFGLVLRQEYAAALSCVFYVLAAASLLGVLFVVLARAVGLSDAMQQSYREALDLAVARGQVTPEMLRLMGGSGLLPLVFSYVILLPLFFLWAWAAVREVFRTGWGRALLATAGAAAAVVVAAPVLRFLSLLLASPFLLLMLFFAARSFFAEAQRNQRARAAFRQNLEAATLNPADASAHYNLGLLHQQRKEYAEARERFRRAVEVDPGETDAHYQLGRIARAEGRLAEAIQHFGEVVSRDEAHAQHEVWREVGATYVAAGQFADARDALGRFLDRRSADPEGLYLMGRAAFGLG